MTASTGELVVQEPRAVSVTPMDLLHVATQQGADVDKLKQLMELQLAWEKNEARKAFVVALNAFKSDPPEIFKNKDVLHNGKFMYRHSTLANASGPIGAALAKVGISHRWDTEQLDGGMIRVTCILTHSMGHSERTTLQASPDTSGAKNAIQAVGSTVQYLQRYTMLAATGMAVQEGDDDGRQGKTGLLDNVKADFLAAIEACATIADSETLWQQIATATTAAGDVAAHESLRAAMAARRKALKTPAKAVTI